MPLFLKNKIYSKHEEDETDQVVHFYRFIFEDQQGKDHKYDEGDYLLDNFELHQRKRAAEPLVADPVGGNLEAIFEESNTPADQDDDKQARAARFRPVEFQVAVPGHGHECIRKYQHSDRCQTFHS